MRIDRIYRYPIKGLSAEALEQVHVRPGEAFPWDRAFALAQGDGRFDPAAPQWVPKTNFMCLQANARIALLKSGFDARHGRISIQAPDGSSVEANALDPAGRAKIAAWLSEYMGPEARGAPQFHYLPGHVFGDQRTPMVSLINEASRADFAERVGGPRERRRFRANLYFSGAPAWSERAWIGRELLVGGARMRVVKHIVRCPATEVNPTTGLRDADPVAELKAAYGHADLGVHAEVLDGGTISMGDAIVLVE